MRGHDFDPPYVDEDPTELVPPTESRASWMLPPTLAPDEDDVNWLVRPAADPSIGSILFGVGVVLCVGLVIATVVPCPWS